MLLCSCPGPCAEPRQFSNIARLPCSTPPLMHCGVSAPRRRCFALLAHSSSTCVVLASACYSATSFQITSWCSRRPPVLLSAEHVRQQKASKQVCCLCACRCVCCLRQPEESRKTAVHACACCRTQVFAVYITLQAHGRRRASRAFWGRQTTLTVTMTV